MLDKETQKLIRDAKADGYTVKYRFYRSEKKKSGFKQTVTKPDASYINSTGKAGTRYFYKVQVRVYDKNGKLIAKTALKQCGYASRIWSRK